MYKKDIYTVSFSSFIFERCKGPSYPIDRCNFFDSNATQVDMLVLRTIVKGNVIGKTSDKFDDSKLSLRERCIWRLMERRGYFKVQHSPLM